jgi:hypothetical protein
MSVDDLNSQPEVKDSNVGDDPEPAQDQDNFLGPDVMILKKSPKKWRF